MFDMHLFSTLRLPAHVTVPDGALNSTGVQTDHNELLLRSRRTETFASQMVPLHEEAAFKVAADGAANERLGPK